MVASEEGVVPGAGCQPPPCLDRALPAAVVVEVPPAKGEQKKEEAVPGPQPRHRPIDRCTRHLQL